ncbi:hypothetical protein K9U39_09325 [Rhodoblastus acidophilus]|uniref:Uncharacterized protein n=1 Tax=Candidatus Rhodoblastus alkanivorans TaxID=2954117 RepID=A0ABS9Z9E2_9HYPH|nr:hypothetical protein [Candidatus Rhodoblastus alkanivorans]MCI4677927.1 hypothetical protein [Candidatus Rhodoblastus alkanivorans]MCI4683822.1 hypothetical protein [Candidatus Rhodoblastus alkanivorans]MDI4641140.1 hypothetical protein [Rhodoblastus acidophilus]
MGSWKYHIKIALLAAMATLAAAFGSWFLATGGQTPAPAEPPLAAKPVLTTPVVVDAKSVPSPPAEAPVDFQKRAALEYKLKKAPEFAPFLTKLRVLYPSDYDSAVKLALAQGVETRDDAPDMFVGLAVQTLRRNRGLMGAKAGAAALDKLFDVHEKVLKQLAATDPALCVDFLNGAPADRFAAFSGAHRALMAEEALAGLQAIDDGAHKRIDREAPTSADFDELEKLMVSKGVDKAGVTLLLDGKTPNHPMTDALQCQNGLIYLDAMKALPDQERLRLYALALEVMAHE